MTNKQKDKDSDNSESQTVEKIDGSIMPMQKERPKEDNHRSIVGRPNINEISKRNEMIANRERKSFYKVAGITALLIITIISLLYFFNKWNFKNHES